MVATIIDIGPLFQGVCNLKITAADAKDTSNTDSFLQRFVAQLGDINHAPGVASEQLTNADRLGKMLERYDDANNYAGERTNALRLISDHLNRVGRDIAGLRDFHHGSLGRDSEAQTLGRRPLHHRSVQEQVGVLLFAWALRRSQFLWPPPIPQRLTNVIARCPWVTCRSRICVKMDTDGACTTLLWTRIIG